MIWDNNEDIRVEQCTNKWRSLQQALNACREERRPYVILTEQMEVSPLTRILVPVSMLEEETYKGEICTYLARKTGARIILLVAHDYGSKARINTQRIVTHIRSIAEKTGTDIQYEIVEAKKDSFSLMKEAATRCSSTETDKREAELIILTASRDYGLDDILFGPQERHAIRRAHVPVMLINPRGDLFSLCD